MTTRSSRGCARNRSRFATIVAPGGEIIAGPISEKEEILYAEIDVAAVARHRHFFDPVGHYARPDVFTLTVNTSRQTSVVFGAEQ